MKFAHLALLILCICLLSCSRAVDSVSPVPANNVTPPPVAALGYHIDLKETAGFGALAVLNQVSLDPQSNQCVIVSSGSDPTIGLPGLTVTPPIQFAVRVELTTPADTVVEIYYTTSGAASFNAEHVVSVPAKAGKSILLFEINDPTFTGGLRFDPGQVPGQYVLHSLEFFSSGPISLAKAPAAAVTP